MIKQLIFVVMVTAMVACSGPDRKKHSEPLEVFATHMLDDGTKLFVFSLEIQQGRGQQGERAKGGGGSVGGRHGGGSGGGGNGGPPQGQGGKSRGPDGDKQLDEKLLATLQQTGYCREGFYELDRTVAAGISSVRGECKDAATDQDRKSFIDG